MPYALLHRWRRLRRRLAGRLTDTGPPPPRAIVILCNPRSGSTWLVDALRCHPAIELHPRYALFTALGCIGRRYPLDLTGPAPAAAGLRIEVDIGQWGQVPRFAAEGRVDPAVRATPHAIEKIHPHFFDHDVGRFLARLAALERGTTVHMVYLARDPDAALVSFLRYKERNPKWNAHIAPADAPRHLRRIYETLLATARRRPGLIVDYGDLTGRLAPTLAAILAELWPPPAEPADAGLLAAMVQATGRAARAQAPTPFLGRDETDRRPAPALTESADLAACRHAYRALLAARPEGRP
jgi:hypothetical protein